MLQIIVAWGAGVDKQGQTLRTSPNVHLLPFWDKDIGLVMHLSKPAKTEGKAVIPHLCDDSINPTALNPPLLPLWSIPTPSTPHLPRTHP